MTEYGLPFDGILLGDASVAPYSASEWAYQWNMRHSIGNRYPNYGVFKGSGSGTFKALEVHASSPAAANVVVERGAALVNGRFYENTTSVTLPVQPNASGNPRIDTVISRVDFVAQTIRLIVKQGAPAASPVRPVLQQDTLIWEIPLADVAVANGFSVINTADITQRQRYVGASAAGWQPYAYPLTYVVSSSYSTNENIAANGGTLVLPVAITGNMLLTDVNFFTNTTSTDFAWGWDIYIQDNNDLASAPDNTLRRVATSGINATGTLPGAPSTLGLSALTPVLLTPGLYWVAYQNRHAANAINLGAVSGGAIAITTGQKQTTTNPNGATLDFATGWATVTNVIPMVLRGRIFGV